MRGVLGALLLPPGAPGGAANDGRLRKTFPRTRLTCSAPLLLRLLGLVARSLGRFVASVFGLRSVASAASPLRPCCLALGPPLAVPCSCRRFKDEEERWEVKWRRHAQIASARVCIASSQQPAVGASWPPIRPPARPAARRRGACADSGSRCHCSSCWHVVVSSPGAPRASYNGVSLHCHAPACSILTGTLRAGRERRHHFVAAAFSGAECDGRGNELSARFLGVG